MNDIPLPPAKFEQPKKNKSASSTGLPPSQSKLPTLVQAASSESRSSAYSTSGPISSSPTTTMTSQQQQQQQQQQHSSSSLLRRAHMALLLLLIGTVVCCYAAFLFRKGPALRSFGHIIPPRHAQTREAVTKTYLSDLTLREFLMDPEGFHLAMAPSFFGFYGYFGMLAAWEEGLTETLVSEVNVTDTIHFLETNRIQSVAGASAGAMAAVLLAMGIEPRKAADFCSNIDLLAFADPPGVGSFFKGNKFEQLMYNFMKSQRPNHSMRMEDTEIPVAVTGFDLQTLETVVMTQGSVSKAPRASATFPSLFQPVHWRDANDESGKDYIFFIRRS
jgi:hypothetical protein